MGGSGDDLYVSDRNGKFLNQIGTKGRGPGEYSFLSSIFLNQDKPTILFIPKRKPGKRLRANYNMTLESISTITGLTPEQIVEILKRHGLGEV